MRLGGRGPGELQRPGVARVAQRLPAGRVVEQRPQRGADAGRVGLGVGHRVTAHLGQRRAVGGEHGRAEAGGVGGGVVVAGLGGAFGFDALGNPTGAFTGHLPTALADATLLAIALGAVAANVLNIYSGALSFTALGIKLPLRLRRAIVAVSFGIIGFIVALTGLHDAGTKYENFLLIIAYWIAPWLAVFFCDQLLRRGPVDDLLFDTRHSNWAGPVAMLTGNGVALAVGIAGALWAGLGVTLALSRAFADIWDVPRLEQPNGFKKRARGLGPMRCQKTGRPRH